MKQWFSHLIFLNFIPEVKIRFGKSNPKTQSVTHCLDFEILEKGISKLSRHKELAELDGLMGIDECVLVLQEGQNT